MYQNDVSDDITYIERLKDRLAKAEENEVRLMQLLREQKDELAAKKAQIKRMAKNNIESSDAGINKCCKTVKAGTTIEIVNTKKSRNNDQLEISENVLLRQKAKIDELHRHLHHWNSIADERTKELQSIYRSEAWIMTWPIRKFLHLFKWLLRIPKAICRWLFLKYMGSVEHNTNLKSTIGKALQRLPRIHAILRDTAVAQGWLSAESDKIPEPQILSNPSFSAMTPKAKGIYLDLKYAIEKRRILDSD